MQMDDLGAIFEIVIRQAPALAAAGVAQISLPNGIHLTLRPAAPAPAGPIAPTLLPLSRPTTDESSESLISRQRRFREAIEFAHVEGYPNPADYGLTPDQVGT